MARKLGSPEIRNVYAFLMQAEDEDRVFTTEDLIRGSGWTHKTTKANISKKLAPYLRKVTGGFKCNGVKHLTVDAFSRICSQNSALSRDPERPSFSPRVEGLVRKACESALAAVQHYNNPTSVFRSGNYIILMVVAYTALFHAVFEREGRDYKEKDNDGNLIIRDGNSSLWNLIRSARVFANDYAQSYDRKQILAVIKNLELMIPIRNKIEHQFMPQLDVTLAGHCQALLMNFEKILTQEFTSYYSLSSSLSLALQFSMGRPDETINALRRFQSAEYEDIRQYIADFHAGLTEEVFRNPAFAFRVWIIPKTANRERNSDVSIEFVPLEDIERDKLEELEKTIIAYKTQHSELMIDPSDECKLLRKEVLAMVQARIGLQIRYGDQLRHLTGPLISGVVKSHGLVSPSKMYFKPKRPGSTAMYGPTFVDWIVDNYNDDPHFFYRVWNEIAD